VKSNCKNVRPPSHNPSINRNTKKLPLRAASLGPIPPPLPPPICTSETLGCSAKMKLREICVIFGCGMCNENVGAQQMRRRRGRYRGVGWCSNHLPRRRWRARRAESCALMLDQPLLPLAPPPRYRIASARGRATPPPRGGPPCLLCSRLLRLVATESPALEGATTPLRNGPPPHHLPGDGPA